LAPEYFERHAGFDTRALNAAADRDAVIAVKSPQQRRLSGAVWPVHDPALTSAHIERDVFEHCVLVKKDRGVSQSHDRPRRERLGDTHAAHGAGFFGFKPARERRAREHTPINDATATEHECVSRARRHIFGAVSGEHPRQFRTSAAFKPCECALPVRRIQTVEQFIEQQESRGSRERAGEKSQTSLAIGQG